MWYIDRSCNMISCLDREHMASFYLSATVFAFRCSLLHHIPSVTSPSWLYRSLSETLTGVSVAALSLSEPKMKMAEGSIINHPDFLGKKWGFVGILSHQLIAGFDSCFYCGASYQQSPY